MICTFYSYKGGVGRSMALANAADILARQGLKVLIIDFDLEAPGIEQFFDLDHNQVRRRQGLLDLLLSYKQAMSVAAPAGDQTPLFMQLQEHFIQPIYNQLPSGGRLDLLAAGQREGQEQLARYALNLRTFDWQEFYFDWAGEAFFEWLRQALVPKLYDVVLVDSRTGVTEMGGICAYQLADTIVMLCASNRQNIDGVHNVVKDFFSPVVRGRRQHRPLQVIIVPARVEQRAEDYIEQFKERFEEAFANYTPEALQAVHLNFWDLQIPYDLHYAFEEKIVTQPGQSDKRRQMTQAFQNVVKALILMAPPDSALNLLRQQFLDDKLTLPEVAEPQYDVTRQFAGYDAFFSYAPADKTYAETLTNRVREEANLSSQIDIWASTSANDEALRRVLYQSRCLVILIGPAGLTPRQIELGSTFDQYTRQTDYPIIPVLLPGANPLKPEELPGFLSDRVGIDLRSGLDDPAPFKRLVETISRVASNLQPATTVQETPYQGLRPFHEQNARFFFGREELVEELLQHLRATNVLTVIGPSGSGKSSLIYAGLIPALRSGAFLRGSETWSILSFRPGDNPPASLAEALVNFFEPQQDYPASRNLAQTLSAEPAALTRYLVNKLRDAGVKRLVVLVDQLEEIYTLCREEALRHSFLDTLFQAADEANNQVILIFTLRADFFGQALSYRPFADALSDKRAIFVGPMSRAELQAAIVKPAQLVGLTFESGLVERILDDVGAEPGALPLLQFLLLELWTGQREGFLTHVAYENIGTVQKALARHADEVYHSLTPKHQKVAQRLFVQLVRPGQGTEDTRRLATKAELGEASWTLVQRLADARLLVVSRSLDGEETVEIAHDALIRTWFQLQDWMNEDRAFRIWQERLRTSLRQWEETGRDLGALLRGMTLSEAETWLIEREADLSHAERSFIQTSLSLREQEVAEREAQRQRELAQAHALAAEQSQRAEEQAQAAHRLRRLAIMVVALALVACGLAISALYLAVGMSSERDAARTAEANAVQSRATLVSNLGTISAQSDLSDSERATARAEAVQVRATLAANLITLATQSASEMDRATLQAQLVAVQATQTAVANLVLRETATAAAQTAAAATQTAIAHESTPTATPSSTASPRPPTPNPTILPTVSLLASPPPSHIIFASGRSSKANLYIMDEDGSNLKQLTPNGGWDPSYSMESEQIVFASQRTNNLVLLYRIDINSNTEINISGQSVTPRWDPTFSPNGRQVAFVSLTGQTNGIYVMDINDPTSPPKPLTGPGSENWAPAWSPDGQFIAFVSRDKLQTGQSEIWRMNTDGDNVIRLTKTGVRTTSPAWSPDSQQIAFASNRDGNFDIYVMNSDGNNLRNITNSPYNEDYPSWSIDGNWLVFSRFTTNNEIFIMTVEGDNLTNLTNSDADDWGPIWIPR